MIFIYWINHVLTLCAQSFAIMTQIFSLILFVTELTDLVCSFYFSFVRYKYKFFIVIFIHILYCYCEAVLCYFLLLYSAVKHNETSVCA